MATKIGIIAEDKSDIDVIEIFVKSLTKRSIQASWFKGDGCGKIHAKCRGWADALKLKGCTSLILVHDLDEKKAPKLRQSLLEALGSCPIEKFVISIPVRELEAWLLSDSDAITRALNLKKAFPKVPNPESVLRPKEKLRDLVYTLSQRRITYVTTIHNPKIAASASPARIASACSSFLPLKAFVETHLA